jgi:hypothetical protein
MCQSLGPGGQVVRWAIQRALLLAVHGITWRCATRCQPPACWITSHFLKGRMQGRRMHCVQPWTHMVGDEQLHRAC